MGCAPAPGPVSGKKKGSAGRQFNHWERKTRPLTRRARPHEAAVSARPVGCGNLKDWTAQTGVPFAFALNPLPQERGYDAQKTRTHTQFCLGRSLHLPRLLRGGVGRNLQLAARMVFQKTYQAQKLRERGNCQLLVRIGASWSFHLISVGPSTA